MTSEPNNLGDARGEVAFVGPGRMGEPMVERLLAVGYSVRTSTKRQEVRERLTALGARVFDTPAEAADGVAQCIACVFSEEQLGSALLSGGVLDALAPGAVLVDHVTASVRGVKALAVAADQRQVRLVDAPVSGTSADIRAGRLAVLLGGPVEAVAAATVLLKSYADWITVTGDIGSATELKLVNNAMFAAQAQLATAVLRLTSQRGFPPSLTLEVLTRCSGTSGALTYLRDHDLTSMDAALEYLVKDVRSLREDAHAAGFDLAEIEGTIAAGPLQIAGTQ